MANDDSDGDGWDSGTSDTPSMKPKPKLISSAFYMECEQTSVDASPCGMTRQQATTWTTAFYGTGGAWTLQTAWKRANDTITSANVLDKIRAGIGLPSNYGDPFRVGAPQKPFTEGTGNREVYALKVNVESTMKETMEKTAKGLETLQKRTVPTHGRLRAQMTHYVMRFFGLTRSYYWTIEGGKKTRGIWVRGTIVGIYFNRKLRRFGGLVLFKHDKAVFDDPDANESMKLQAPFLLALPDLDGFDEHPLRSKWPPVPAPVEQRLVRVHERCIARGYFYVTKPPRVAIVWAWVDDIILAVDAAPPDRHKLAVRHKTRVVDEGGRSVTRTGMYARLHKVPPHFYVRVEEVNKRELTVTVDYGTKFWRILHEELRPPWSQNGKRVMNHNECQAAYVHIVHDLPDNMMVPVSGGPITWYADAERHDIMVTYNQLVIYNKFQNDTWLSTNASYISKAGVKVVRDRLHDEGNKTDAQKNAVTALLRSTIVAFVHAGVAASAVRAAAMGAHGDLDRGALVKRVSYVMAVRRMRTAMWAAQSVGAAYWLRSNPKFKELEDQDADHDSDSSDEGAVTNDEGFLEDKFTTARSGVGKGYTFGFSAMEGGPTSMRGIMPKLKKTFIRCMWKHTASRRFAVDYTDAVDRMAPVDDNPSRMMRLGTLDAYQVQLFNRYLGVVHDIRAWGSFVMGSRDLVPGPESVLTYAATNTKRLVGPPNAVLPVVPALEFDRLEGLNEAYVPVTRSVANGTALPVHIASKVASNAFPMPAKASFVEQKLFGPNQRRGNAILEALGFSEATHVCNRLSAQYPVHVPFALYETSNNVSKTIPRARFMQLYVDALFWVAPIRSSNSGGVVLVEYKTMAENRPELVSNRLNDASTIKQTLFNAWVFQLHTGVKVYRCVVIYLTRRADDDAYAAGCSFDPNRPELKAVHRSFLERPVRGTGIRVVFDENLYVVVEHSTFSMAKKIAGAWLWGWCGPDPKPTELALKANAPTLSLYQGGTGLVACEATEKAWKKREPSVRRVLGSLGEDTNAGEQYDLAEGGSGAGPSTKDRRADLTAEVLNAAGRAFESMTPERRTWFAGHPQAVFDHLRRPALFANYNAHGLGLDDPNTPLQYAGTADKTAMCGILVRTIHRLVNQSVFDELGYPAFVPGGAPGVVTRGMRKNGTRPQWSDTALGVARDHISMAEARVKHELLALPLVP